MNIDINILMQLYKEKIINLQEENIILKAQVIQLQNAMKEEQRQAEFTEGDA